MRPAAALATAAALLTLVAAVRSHPAELECGTDATTRLQVGAVVMGGAASMGPAVDGVSVKYDVGAGNATVIAPAGTFFAVRLQGGGSLTAADPTLLHQTAGCPAQLFTPTTGAAGGTYDVQVNTTNKTAFLVVGYSGMGPPGIKLARSD